MKANKNIIIRNLTNEDNQILDSLRTLTGSKTNSQTILRIIREYAGIMQDLDAIIAELQAVCAQKQTIANMLNDIRQILGYKREFSVRKKIDIKNGTQKI